jgi:beta-phosphoglucomutase-like phosphatase (HAD superfamily)
VPLRIAFDLDGVLADMDGELLRQAEAIFGAAMKVRAADEESAPDSVAAEPDATPAVAEQDTSKLLLTARQERRLWRHVGSIDNFWETLKEIEPGAIARLANLATEHRWEIIFLTKRPATAGATSQVQSQRWLSANGFRMPSVFVVQGSRGRIAAALGLDLVVDDRPENCLDVVVDSRARSILVWRDDQAPPPSTAKRLGIGVVKSVDECLSILTQLDAATAERSNVIDRVMRRLGLKAPA